MNATAGQIIAQIRHRRAVFARYVAQMSEIDALKDAFRTEVKPSRRERRARATLAHALSPARILTQVLLVPIVTIAMTVSIYIRTSPYERVDALRHLAAMAGCDTARSMGLAPAFKGEIGYHKRNDADGNGIACEDSRNPLAGIVARTLSALPEPAQYDGAANSVRMDGGAKFVKPTQP